MIVPGEFCHLRVFQRAITIMVASYKTRILEEMGIVESVNSALFVGLMVQNIEV